MINKVISNSFFIFILHVFSEQEHFVVLAPVLVNVVGDCRTVPISVPELYDMEAEAVDVEMDVAFSK